MFVFVAAVVVDIIVVLCAGSERTDLRWGRRIIIDQIICDHDDVDKKEDKN